MNEPVVMDLEVGEMIKARAAPATAKTELATLRSTYPKCIIFCFEGVDDKPVYFQWIRRINNNLEYESFICSGKTALLSLKASLEQDLGGLKDGVYLFVDRDFDDLRGQSANEFTYMTSCYSFENHLATSEVVQNFLKNEFHCLSPIIRGHAISAFEKAYSDFLDCTSEYNFRLYCARKLKIPVLGKITSQANKLAAIQLTSCTPSGESASAIVALTREPTDDETSSLKMTFLELDRPSRYRGKFAFAFFSRWLDLLARDYRAKKPQIFEYCEEPAKIKGDICEIGRVGGKSQLPPCLIQFVKTTSPPKRFHATGLCP